MVLAIHTFLSRTCGLTCLTHNQPVHRSLSASKTSAGAGGRLIRSFSLTFLTALLVSCVDPQSGYNQNGSLKSSWVRPDDPQERIGEKEHPAVIARYGGVYANPEAERMLAVVVSRLVSVSQDPSRVYKVTLLDSPKVNAFALPGGFLYVTRGLLALANDSSEIAAVLAHEMAHVSANHALIRQERLNSAALGEQVASEVLTGSRAGQFAVAANRLRLSAFSKDQELQADTIGIRLMGRAGYDPYAASRFLKTMGDYRSLKAGDSSFVETDNFSSSHPSTPKRIELAVRHARFFGAPGVGSRDRDRYLDGIDGMLFGDSPEEGFVRGRQFSHAGLGVTFQAPEGFQIDNQPKAVMITGPNDIATRFDATVASARTDLSEYLKSGWISGLVEETIREETINGLPSASARAQGDGWRFKVRVVRNGSQLYRFITAAPQTNTNLDAVSRQITGTFRSLSKREIAALKPLTVRIVTVANGQTTRDMVGRMKLSPKLADSYFRLLNGLNANEEVTAGQRVKIIAD